MGRKKKEQVEFEKSLKAVANLRDSVLKMLYLSFPDLAKVRNSLLASENIKRFKATIAQNSKTSLKLS